MQLRPIDFSDLPLVLHKCARVVVDEITRSIYRRVTPRGIPQKENKPSTVRKKGHDHPLVERTGRYMDKDTYGIQNKSDHSVEIRMNPNASKIAGYLEKRGYYFFDIPDVAETRITAMLDRYIIRKIKESFRG